MDGLTGRGALEKRQEDLDVGLEGVQVGDSVFDELRSNQLAGIVPDIAVSGEDAWKELLVRVARLVLEEPSTYSIPKSPSTLS